MWLASLKLFDVTISDLSNNKSYPTFSCEYHTHVQHYLSTFRTLHSLMFVAYKKNFFCVATNMSHNFDMLKKFFCWHNFFAKIFHNIFFWDGKYTATFPSWREYSTVFFPYREIYVISNIFANKLYPAKIFFMTSHIVYVLVTLANVTYRIIRLRYLMFANITHTLF